MNSCTPELRTPLGNALVKYILPVVLLAVILFILLGIEHYFKRHEKPDFSAVDVPAFKYMGYAFYIVIPAGILVLTYFTIKDWNEKINVTENTILRTTIFRKQEIKISEIKSIEVFRSINAVTRYNPLVWLLGSALGTSHSIEIIDAHNRKMTIGEIQKSKGLKFCEEIEAMKSKAINQNTQQK